MSGHIGYFYSNFSSFINNVLNVTVYCLYLVNSNLDVLLIFGFGLVVLLFPLKKIISKTRDYVDRSFYVLKDSMSEIERVIENLFLIKILKKEDDEIAKFSNSLNTLKSHQLNKHSFGVLNGFLPSFLTLFILVIVLIFFQSVTLTLDFIGVTLKLFSSISGLSLIHI